MRRWPGPDVLLPFAVTRLALFWTAWWTQQLEPAATVLHEAAARGWTYLPNRYLDAFGRMDTGWYLSIAQGGYWATPPTPALQTNAAFYPLYPALIRLVHAVAPGAGWYGAALLVANVCAVAALAVVYLVAREGSDDAREGSDDAREGSDDARARRAVLWMLVFPTGFFLSCAYSESLFLLVSAGALLSAQRSRWVAAGLLAALAAVTRASGILLVPALAVMFLVRERRLRAPALALLLPFATLAAHALWLGHVTGDRLAFLHAQAAWHRHFAWPWQTLAIKGHHWVGQLDRLAILFAAVSAVVLLARRQWGFGVYVAVSLAPVLFSGSPASAARILSVAFPAFFPLADATRSERAQVLVAIPCVAAQALLFMNWVRLDWAG